MYIASVVGNGASPFRVVNLPFLILKNFILSYDYIGFEILCKIYYNYIHKDHELNLHG